MKQLISLVLATAPLLAFAQEKYVIKGRVGHLNSPAVAHLSYSDNGNLRSDSSSIVDGLFKFSGEIGTVTQGRLIVIRNPDNPNTKVEAIIVYLANGTTLVNTPDSLEHAAVTGTKANEDEQEYLRFIKDNRERHGRDSLFIATHPDSWVSLQLIKNRDIDAPDYSRLNPLFSQLSPSIRNSPTGMQYRKFLDALKAGFNGP